MSLRRAIILAAGHGSRMGALTAGRPKALLEVDGRALIDHQLDALAECGVHDVTVVSGYLHSRLQDHLAGRVRFVKNSAFAATNSLYSLGLAASALGNGAVVMNSDLLVSPELLARLIEAAAPDAALVDGSPVAGPEEMKVTVRDGYISDFGKDLAPGRTDGENVGVLKFGAEGSARLSSHLAALAPAHCRAWAPLAFRALAQEWPLRAIFTDGLPWIEIDFPADLERARNVVAPAMVRRHARRTA